MKPLTFDVVIIGAGAAGLMSAQLAGALGHKVLIIDHSLRLAEKIRISGGGRCNFTNINAAPECYLSQNPHFVKSALSRYTPYHFIELLDKFNITYHEKTLGQLFCDGKSQTIIDLLDFLCTQNGVTRKMGVTVKNITQSPLGFTIDSSIGTINSEQLIVATGGLAIPQIGATGFGYNLARQFNLDIVPTSPALVPLTLDPKDLITFANLSGISFNSEVTTGNTSFVENTLFTHRGLSGPAILQASSYWSAGETISINMLPSQNIADIIKENKSSNKKLSTLLGQFISSRLANTITDTLGQDHSISQLSNDDTLRLTQLIHNFTLIPSGTSGYKKAEVTKGGVSTKDINSKTMMSKVNGLYFIGEVVDVTGWLGGYNFQWAWASASAAATSL